MKNLMLCMIKDCKADCFIGEPMVVQNEFQASQVLTAFNSRYNKNSKHDFQIYKVADFDPSDKQPILSCVPELLSAYCEDEDEDEVINE